MKNLYIDFPQARTFKDIDLHALEYTFFDGWKYL
jgi:hypothetical protein